MAFVQNDIVLENNRTNKQTTVLALKNKYNQYTQTTNEITIDVPKSVCVKIGQWNVRCIGMLENTERGLTLAKVTTKS